MGMRSSTSRTRPVCRTATLCTVTAKRHLRVNHPPFKSMPLCGHTAHCGVCGTHQGRITICMLAGLPMKCHCGPRGSSFALAWRVKAAKTAATKIVLITGFHGWPLSASRIMRAATPAYTSRQDKPMILTANYAAVRMVPNQPRTARPIQATYLTRDGLSCFRGRSTRKYFKMNGASRPCSGAPQW
jgi:hypothetical protein